jgi:putative endonuclease
MTKAWVYLLRCRDGSLYTGWTIDLDRRLARHQAGSASRYTASRRPVELAVALPMPGRTEARREEVRIKRMDRAAKLALIARETRSEPDQSSRGAGAKTIRLSSVRALPPSRSAV